MDDYQYQKQPRPSYKYDPDYDPYTVDPRFEYTIDTVSKQDAAKNKVGGSNLSGKLAGVAGGFLAGVNQGEKVAGNPYDTKEAYKPDGLGVTNLSEQLIYQRLKDRKSSGKSVSNFDYMVADATKGMFGGGTEGFASGGWIGAIVGAATGGVSSVVTGDKARTKFRNELRDMERESKLKWQDRTNAIARVGANSGAYTEGYTGVSQLAIDAEKRNLDEYYNKLRKQAGMKEYNSNPYAI